MSQELGVLLNRQIISMHCFRTKFFIFSPTSKPTYEYHALTRNRKVLLRETDIDVCYFVLVFLEHARAPEFLSTDLHFFFLVGNGKNDGL
jgi:hypothetical protein